MSMQNSHQISEVKVMLVKGDNGRGIVSIEKTSTAGVVDTYTITYTDGTKSTFNVTNGGAMEENTFTISSNDWAANTESDSDEYPWIYTITTSLYSDSYIPAAMLLLGSDEDDYPTEEELECIGMISPLVKFTGSAIRLRATDMPTTDLTLIIKG